MLAGNETTTSPVLDIECDNQCRLIVSTVDPPVGIDSRLPATLGISSSAVRQLEDRLQRFLSLRRAGNVRLTRRAAALVSTVAAFMTATVLFAQVQSPSVKVQESDEKFTVPQTKPGEVQELTEQDYARIKREIKNLRHDLELAYWGQRYNAINRLKRRVLATKTILPSELKDEAIQLLKECKASEPDGSVKRNATETLEILAQGADRYFGSLSTKGELEKTIDNLIVTKLNSVQMVEHEDAEMMLLAIGKSALPRLAAGLFDQSGFLTGEARIGGQQQGGNALVVLASSTLRGRLLSLIETMVIANQDIDVKELIPALAAVADTAPENRTQAEGILKRLSTRERHRAQAQEALDRNRKGPQLRERVKLLAQAMDKTSEVTPASRSNETIAGLANTLAEIGPPAADAVPSLIKALETNNFVQMNNFRFDESNNNVIRALGNIGPAAKDAVPVLVKKLEEPPSQWYGYQTKSACITALGNIGPAAKAALEELKLIVAENQSEQLVKAAKDAISKIETKP